MAEWRHRAIALGLGLIGMSRIDRACGTVARGRGLVLMLHSVSPARNMPFEPNAALEITPEFLGEALDVLSAEGFEFVPLDAILARLRHRPSPRPFVAVTFDDGYRDNRDFALPVLEARGVPWTVFVTTEFAEGTGRIWWIELQHAVERLGEIRLPGPRGEIVLPTYTTAQKARAFAFLHTRARAADRTSLVADLDRLADAARLDPRAILRERCMDWDELQVLSRRPGVQIGAHAISHHALAQLGPTESRREILQGRRILRERLGLPIRHLSFPYGDAAAVGPREFAYARQAGFRTALTTRPGHLSAGDASSLHALPRVSVNGHFQRAAVIRTLASGVPFLGPGAIFRNATHGSP